MLLELSPSAALAGPPLPPKEDVTPTRSKELALSFRPSLSCFLVTTGRISRRTDSRSSWFSKLSLSMRWRFPDRWFGMSRSSLSTCSTSMEFCSYLRSRNCVMSERRRWSRTAT
jgi:hypothetical protein